MIAEISRVSAAMNGVAAEAPEAAIPGRTPGGFAAAFCLRSSMIAEVSRVSAAMNGFASEAPEAAILGRTLGGFAAASMRPCARTAKAGASVTAAGEGA